MAKKVVKKVKKMMEKIEPVEEVKVEIKPEIQSSGEVEVVEEKIVEIPVIAEDPQKGLKEYIKCLQSLRSEMEKQGIRDLSQLDALLGQKLSELK